MTRQETATLQRLKAIARHTHPGTVGPCTDWTCDVFLEAIAPYFNPTIAAAAGDLVVTSDVTEPTVSVAAHPAAEVFVAHSRKAKKK